MLVKCRECEKKISSESKTCIHCGCPDFHMDWDEMIYKCSDCHEPIDADTSNYGKEKRPKEGVKKFKGEE